jgi:ABC-type Fe3+ transport system permease subunit
MKMDELIIKWAVVAGAVCVFLILLGVVLYVFLDIYESYFKDSK